MPFSRLGMAAGVLLMLFLAGWGCDNSRREHKVIRPAHWVIQDGELSKGKDGILVSREKHVMEITTRDAYPADPADTVKIKLHVRNLSSSPCYFYVSYIPLDEKRNPMGTAVNAKPETFTSLWLPAKDGDTQLYVGNAGKWQAGDFPTHGAKADLSDLPNGSQLPKIKSVEKISEHNYKVMLSGPVGGELPAGTFLRTHGHLLAVPMTYRLLKPGEDRLVEAGIRGLSAKKIQPSNWTPGIRKFIPRFFIQQLNPGTHVKCLLKDISIDISPPPEPAKNE